MYGPDDSEKARARRFRADAQKARERLDQFGRLRARFQRGETLEADQTQWLDDYDEAQQRRDARLVGEYLGLAITGDL